MFPKYIHRKLYITGIVLIALGMPVSTFLMSVGQFFVVGNWLLEGNFIEKIKRYTQNKIALILTSITLLQLIGLIYTSDFSYAWQDIRIKAPLFVIPFLIASTETISKKELNIILGCFSFAVFCGIFVCTGVNYGLIHTKKVINESRDISIFISHIRFSLMIVFALFINSKYVIGGNIFQKWLAVFFVTTCIFFLFLLNSLTGIFILLITAALLALIYLIKNHNKKVLILILSSLLLGSVFTAYYLNNLYKQVVISPQQNYIMVDSLTQMGNPYLQYENNHQTENGNYVLLYICWPELEKAWAEKSQLPIDAKNKRGDVTRYTLLRYLTSKNLRKDYVGVNSLSNEDIMNIENGIANVTFANKNKFTVRLLETIWEFKSKNEKADYNNHSTTMRLEFWKGALHIIKNNWLIGVGTGDVKQAYHDYYNQTNSPLTKENRLRAHNQYLSYTIGYGIIGLIWLGYWLLGPFVLEKKWTDFTYLTFFIIIIFSFLNEDTLETQAGVTFFAFFNSILLLRKKDS